MSTFGGFSGFGQSSNQNTGGFGSTNPNPTTTGFGSGFGSSSTTTNPFGGGAAPGGFGSGGGFGQSSNSTSLFGQSKPAFGATSSSGTSLFGNTATTGSGGFGGGTSAFGTTTANNSPFGGGNTGGSFSFGQSKPAFGGGGGGGTGIFGSSGGTTGTSGFGANQSNPFGQAGAGTALGQGVPPSEGTAVTPFNPTNEKDPTGNGTNSFQSINFMPAYSKYSFEELRLADYDKGRRYGNGSGQAGGFGGGAFGGSTFGGPSSTGFGGTASSNPFGATSSSGTGFGQTSTSGYGGGTNFLNTNTNKPAAGGLFGGQSSSAPSGGLFGTAPQSTGSAFGGTGTTFGQAGSSSSPFGSSQAQSKPSLFGSTSGGLGGSTTGGGLFGGSGSTGFGANQPAQGSIPFSAFGTQNQQGQQGQDQSKPGGLFGSGGFGTTQTSQVQPSGGLFGGTQPSTGGGGLFGGSTSGQGPTGFGATGQSAGGGLFGGTGAQQQKPSLFGGTGSFGGTHTQSTGGLFGGTGTTPQQGGSLFGGTSTNNSGGLFSNNQQQQKPGLFGTSQPNPAIQNNSLFGGQSTNSLFNTSQQSQQTPQQPQALHSSLLDGNPYGQSSIWSGLPEATPQNSGPLVTPLSASQRLRESQMKAVPSFRLSSSKLMTPPRRLGYGFTYSTYGTPNSAASTPGGGGLSSSMYGRSFTGGSFGRSVGKSFSASNLRQQFATDGESVLSPGAFAPGSSRYSSGSIRRLTIDRNLKADLFSRPAPSQQAPPGPSRSTNGGTNGATNSETSNGIAPTEQSNKLKKRVSFDNNTTGGTQDGSTNGVNGALVRTDDDGPEPSAEEQGFLRSSRRGKPANGNASAPPQMEQIRGNELAAVPEDRETSDIVSKMRLPADAPAAVDPKPGEYWMKPSRAELSKMPRDKLQNFKGFQVGRQGCGYVTFEDEVDLTTVPLDDLFGKIVEIRIRSISVYSDASTKPPRGKGLNVPSTIHLENSWPRSRGAPSSATSGLLFDRHIQRLKKMPNTQYVSYDTQTGVWTFQVPHYTRYGLDFDDEDENGDDSLDSRLSDPPNDLTEPDQTPRGEDAGDSVMDVDGHSPEESSPEDDTFDFKRKSVPGGFDRQSAIDYHQDESFLGDAAAGAVSGSDTSYESDEQESGDEMNMAGSFPQPELPIGSLKTPAESAMKASQNPWGTPGRPLIDLDGDWAEQLQRTISPRKQNREALREIQGKVLLDRVNLPTKQQIVSNQNEIRTNIDLMNSLFGQHEERMALSRKKNEGEHGIEYPYSKRAKTFDAGAEMAGPDQKWHDSFPVKWTPTGSLLYAHEKSVPPKSEQAWRWRDSILHMTQKRNIIKSSLIGDGRASYSNSEWGWHNAKITVTDGVPFAKQKPMKFSAFWEQIAERDQQIGQTEESKLELDIYELAHVLFDKYEDQFSRGLSPTQKSKYAERIRKDRLSEIWTSLIQERRAEQLQSTPSEENIIALLSAHQIHDACYRLSELGSPRLSTMIAQFNVADDHFQSDMAEQLQAWRDQSIISEMSEPIRALYELLAGNTTISQGKPQGPLENRASSFAISERFDLDWMQAFGFCLWYGKAKNGNIEDAVRDFAEKLAAKQESAIPFPDGVGEGEQQHPLWVLLQLYAATKGTHDEAPALPQALTPLSRPFDNRIPFQLHHALVANIPTLPVSLDLADKLAIDLSFQLSASSFHLGAIFALMHISDPVIREDHIRDLLTRHAATLPQMLDRKAAEIDKQWQILVEKLKVPTAWICRAKAIYFRAMNQSLNELRYLLLGEDWVEAHECLCRRVAPRAVIEEDWNVIRAMVGQFGNHIKEWVQNWGTGGGMYEDFVNLIGEQHHSKRNNAEKGSQEGEARVKRLQSALEEMGRIFKKRGSDLMAGGLEELEQRVACQEMARRVADVAARELKQNNVLDLPLTADAKLSHAKEMALRHYRAVMAAAH